MDGMKHAADQQVKQTDSVGPSTELPSCGSVGNIGSCETNRPPFVPTYDTGLCRKQLG